MRPLKLALSAFGPYLTAQEVDFERLGEHGLFLIHGRTGSGKSSVLDALCFALFGKSTGDERKGEDFITTLDRGAETKVMLEFEHLGVRYCVTRRPAQAVAKKRGEGFTNRPTEATLEDLDSGEVIAAKASDVTAAVEEMLRCDVEQFRQTVVLPQGDFRKVVTEHRARREILATIFRTQRFADVAVRLADGAKQLAREGQDLQDQRARLLAEQGAENVVELEEALARAVAEVEQRSLEKRGASAANAAAIAEEAAAKALADDFESLGAERDRGVELEGRKAEFAEQRQLVTRAEKAARLIGHRDELENRRSERDELETEARLTHAARGEARAALAARREELAALEPQRPRLEATEELRQKLTRLKPQVDLLASKLERQRQLERSIAAAEHDLQGASAALADLAERSRAAAAEQSELQSLVEGELEASRLLTSAEDDLEQLDKVVALQQELANLDKALDDRRGQFDPVALLTEAVTANAPGLLAAELAEGEPCPVCGSSHHPSPTTHGDVEALRRAFAEFGESSADVAKLRERRAARQRDVDERLVRKGWQDSPPVRVELEARAAAERAAVEAIAAARNHSQELRAALDGYESERAERQRQKDELAARLSGQQQELAAAGAEIKSTREQLAPEHREPEAFTLALATATAESEALRARFDEVSKNLTLAEQGLERNTAAATGAEGRLQSASERLAGLEEKFDERLTAAGFSGRDDFEDAARPDDELSELQRGVREYDEAVKINAATVEHLSQKLAGRELPDLAALAAAVAQAGDALTRADEALGVASTAGDRLQGALERFRALERQDADVADRRLAAQKLSDLANGNLKGRAKVNFETFVLRSIFARVLAEANHHLKNMTGGRYSMLLLADPGGRDTGLELDVRDNQSGGETRPVHTLSGGEGFLASLALALGLSEISQRESGGVELGALFIDEGFGSLDSQSLDLVIDILRGLEQGHRLVGIISHVEDLKHRIPVQLLVKAGATGSRVEMVINA